MVQIVTIDGAGRIVIPSAIRRRLHLRGGSRLRLSTDGERLVLVPEQDVEGVAEEGGLFLATGRMDGRWRDHRQLRDERVKKLSETD